MDDWTGRVLSKVRIEEMIGRGGMADVYVGRHTTLNRPMAVKILHSHMTVNPDLRRRFRDEAQAVAALRHPNIVQVVDFDVVEDRPYIVMELLEGMPLSEHLRGLHGMGHTLPLDTVSRLMTSITSALEYAHQRQIVHRDVKPANIILRKGSTPIKPQLPLGPEVEPVLTDFGVARIATSTTPTASGTILGTPAYMSPEQVRGEPVDQRSDIYSLGIILYEILAGKLPFNPETDTPASILYKHVHEEPPVVPNVSPALQRVVERSLAKDRDARYQRAGQLASDLQATTKAVPSDASTEAMVTKLSVEGPAVPATPPRAAGAERQRRVRPTVALVAGLALGAVVLVGGVFVGSQLLRGQSANPTPVPAPTEALPANEAAAAPEATVVVPTEDAAVPSDPAAFAIVRDGQVELRLPEVESPAAGQTYHAWMLGEQGIEPLNLNRSGGVDLIGSELSISYAHPEEINLLAKYPELVISLEGEGSLLDQPGEVVYRGSFDPDTVSLLQLADEVNQGDPVTKNLADWLPRQTEHFIIHSNFALDGVTNPALDLNYIKTHSEHSLNILEGKNGEFFRDWDSNGAAENPGDAVGVGPYLALLKAAADGGAQAERLRGGSGEAAMSIATRLGEIEELLERLAGLNGTIQRMLVVDTIQEIVSGGIDSDLQTGQGIKELVDQLVADAAPIDLAFAIEIFPAQ